VVLCKFTPTSVYIFSAHSHSRLRAIFSGPDRIVTSHLTSIALTAAICLNLHFVHHSRITAPASKERSQLSVGILQRIDGDDVLSQPLSASTGIILRFSLVLGRVKCTLCEVNGIIEWKIWRGWRLGGSASMNQTRRMFSIYSKLDPF